MAAAGFSFAAVAEGGRRIEIKLIAFNQIPTTTSIAMCLGVDADARAMRQNGLLASVIGSLTAQNTFSIDDLQLVGRNQVAIASSRISNCWQEAC